MPKGDAVTLFRLPNADAAAITDTASGASQPLNGYFMALSSNKSHRAPKFIDLMYYAKPTSYCLKHWSYFSQTETLVAVAETYLDADAFHPLAALHPYR